MTDKKKLMAVVELGGYPNFSSLYRELGFDVLTENSVRNALRTLKKVIPRVVVAEFNFQSDFRDRTSNLESLLSTLQRFDDVRVVVFYDEDFHHQLQRLQAQYPLYAALPYPIEPEALRGVIQQCTA